jgi:RNA polymerase sigma factor (TIGR02999 family)
MNSQITQLLKKWGSGDKQVEADLFAQVYKELRQLAGHYIRQERPGHTLQPTALVHEVYVRVLESASVDWQDRKHFMAVASRAMRRVLVDYAKARHAAKRRVPEAEAALAAENKCYTDAIGEEVLSVHAALDKLALSEPRQAQVVELRYFGGLSFEETADTLGISVPTVKRDWQLARVALYKEIAQVSL